MVSKGDAFQASGPNVDVAHLWIVISDPNEGGNVVCVNFTSLSEDEVDESCILDPGDHPFIKRRTVVKYGLANWWAADKIAAAIASGQFSAHPPVRPEILQRIREGGLNSLYLNRSMKAALR